ncbi:MAG: SDR family oxidoreductase [Alphaproteobacteria bacterium]|nr:SDR family oxidoreductase [Alphaproteobacteria bacterium]
MGERLKGRTVLVFGAGSSGPGWGNGKAAAVAFAREGANVAAVDLREEAAAETCGIIREEGGTALALAADVTRGEDVARAVAATVGAFGRIDVLHNNVGITAPGGPIEESEESWRRVIDTNITSVFLTCKHVLPLMVAQKKGAIVNVSSLAAIRWTGYPYFSYYASKAGLNQMTVAIALQHARDGVRCNAIMPGPMDTPLIRQQIVKFYASEEEMLAQRNAMCPMGRMGTAWDVANAAVFLASDEAGYITGVCLPVDGGVSCKVS